MKSNTSLLPQLLIIGTAGFAREVAQLAYELNIVRPRWQSIGFIASDASEIGRKLGRYSVVADDATWLAGVDSAEIVIGIGRPAIRAKIAATYIAHSSRHTFPNLIHPSATLDLHTVHLGQGNIITAGCRFTCDIQIGDFNVFNLNSTIGHDTQIGSCNVINPSVNLSGYIQLHDQILIGTGAQLLEHSSIGFQAVVGAGAVVTKAVQSQQTVVGVPARPLRK